MMIPFMFALIVLLVLYLNWRTERRKSYAKRIKTATPNSAVDVFRQSERFRQSSLFELLLGGRPSVERSDTFESFIDRFNSFADVAQAMNSAGVNSCNFIVAVDFSASNEWQGRRSYNRQSLHSINSTKGLNPYQQVLTYLHQTLQTFAIPGQNYIHAFGFGCREAAASRGLLPFANETETGGKFRTFRQVYQRYNDLVRQVDLSGPTSYATVLRKSVKIVKKSNNTYHVLIIITDGQLPEDESTTKAIVDASNHPLSIVVIGVGDGPFTRMQEYDDSLVSRRFDNFQFVDFNSATSMAGKKLGSPAKFAMHCCMEIPDQYRAMQRLGYL